MKRFTKVKVQGFEGKVMNDVDGGYRISIQPRKKGQSWWVVIPEDMVEVIDED